MVKNCSAQTYARMVDERGANVGVAVEEQGKTTEGQTRRD